LGRLRQIAKDVRRIQVYKKRCVQFFGGDYQRAVRVASAAIQALSESNFSETKKQVWDMVDVYGVEINKRGWLLKVCIEDDAIVHVISLHPLEYRIRTNGGWIEL